MLRDHNRKPRPKKEWKWQGTKPRLAVRVIPTYRVNYVVLQEYLTKVYRLDVDVLRIAGLTAGMTAEFIVTGELPSASSTKQVIENIRWGRRGRDLRLIMNLLCFDGFIPSGKYLLDTTKPPRPIEVYRELLQKHQDQFHPECAEFLRKHQDKTFRKQAMALIEALNKLKEEANRAN